MRISQENEVWLHEGAKELGTTPEALLNGILRSLRNENGTVEGNLSDWMDRGRRFESDMRAVLENMRDTNAAVSEASRAARLYVSQLTPTTEAE